MSHKTEREKDRADRALQIAKILLEDNQDETFVCEKTPFMNDELLAQAFQKLGCQLKWTGKRGRFVVTRTEGSD